VAASQLATAEELTGPGRHFSAAIIDMLDAWRTEPIPPEAAVLADEVAGDHEASWRMRNLEPDGDTVARLARDWCARAPRPSIARTPVVQRPADRRLTDSGSRLDLLYLSLQNPDAFHRLAGDPAALADAYPEATPADVVFARGDGEGAADAYRAQVKAMPDRSEAWTGLALALRRTGAHEVGDMLADRPEVVAATYRRIVEESETAPPIEQLITWLAPALG
jgi:hypothetical protein